MELFSNDDQEHIAHAIHLAENRTSGEIRVCAEKHCKGDVLDRAAAYFHRLGMDKTNLRNGVLIYIATEDHQFAIIGDQGINNKVGSDFWNETKERMLEHFRKGQLTDGLIAGIRSAGEQLKTHFPRFDDDINELPNEIHFGDGR